MASDDLIAKRDKIQSEILALENTLGADGNIADQLSSDSSSDDDSDESEPIIEGVEWNDLEAERLRIQREIEELENTLNANAALADVLEESENDADCSDEDSDDDSLDLPQNVETCLQMNLVYQEVLKEKLDELEHLLRDNQQQQKEIEDQLSGPGTSSSPVPGLHPQKQYLGYFMKPYFKDKLTGLGPPANEESKERLKNGTRPIDELKIKRWEGWKKTLLTSAVTKDTMRRMLQPKLSKLDYLSAKMSKASNEEKQELKKQIDTIEKEIAEISSLKDDQLMGDRHDDHDWDKISNIDFEGLHLADDLKRFWQNFLHPSINKSVWKQDEINKLKGIVEEYKCCHWDKIAEALGTNRTAFMCFQTYQRYISKTFKRNQWTKEEDEILKDLVEKMRVGNYIPYTQMSYFMEGRDGSQLGYRWTSVLDPSLKKGPWSKEEDQLLRNAVAKYGTREWGKIKMEVPGRTDSACRDRYLDCLRENVKKGPWSEEEVELLKQKVEKYGVGKWTKIASEIPNRIDCQCLHKWKLLTKAAQNRGKTRTNSNKRKQPTVVKQKAKRRKVLKKKIKKEINTSSSEDEEKIKYLNSDAESDVAIAEQVEIQQNDYVQPNMKEWIPAVVNTPVLPPGTLRIMWVRPPTNDEGLTESSKETGLGQIPSENNVSPIDGPRLVRNTILNCFGNIERSYMGANPIVLRRQTDDEQAMIRVSVRDLKTFIQWKGASVMRKKAKSPGDKKKRRSVPDMCSLNYDLLKAMIPWTGNVVLPRPANENTICEGDVIGIKAAKITLWTTPVFTFLIKAVHIDVKGCRNVIKLQEKMGHTVKKPVAVSKPIIVPQKTVAEMLQEAQHTPEHEKPAELPQNPQKRLHQLKPPQLQGQQITAPAFIHPNTLVITQPSMQGAAQPLLFSGVLLPQSPPNVISQLPLPLVQQTMPLQLITTSASNSPSVKVSNTGRSTKRARKPTEKVQALMEEAKAKKGKKESLKQNQGDKNLGFPMTTLQMQPVFTILSPTRLIQVTGPLSSNIPSNLTPNMPNSVPCNSTSTNPNKSMSAPVVATSAVNCTVINSPSAKDTLNTSTSLKLSPRSVLHLTSSHLAENKSAQQNIQMSSQSPNQVKTTKKSSDGSSSDETIVRQNLSPPGTGPRVSPAVFSILPIPLTLPTSVGGPIVSNPEKEVALANLCRVSTNAGVAVRTSQLPTVIQQQTQFRHIQPLGELPQVVASPVIPPIILLNEPLPPLPDLTSDGLGFDRHLIFPEHTSEVDDWMKGEGGIPVPHLETSLPYLPPSVASIKTLTSLLKAKQSLVISAAKLLPVQNQSNKEEEAQVAAIRKMIAEKFASNPAYQLFKARFLSCFTLPALLATINPNEKSESATEKSSDEDWSLDSQETTPAKKIELNTNGNEASAKQFSGIGKKRQRRGRQVT